MQPTIKLLDEALAGVEPASKPSRSIIKDQATKHVRSLATVINYIITDAFGLDAEESMWFGYNVNQVLEPLTDVLPSSILVAVDQEMNKEEYSTRLMRLLSDPERIQSTAVSTAPNVQYATLNDWVEGICEVVLGSFPTVRPMYKSRIVGSVHGLFIELGLTNNLKTSRASLYLPNSVRFLLNSNEYDDEY